MKSALGILKSSLLRSSGNIVSQNSVVPCDLSRLTARKIFENIKMKNTISSRINVGIIDSGVSQELLEMMSFKSHIELQDLPHGRKYDEFGHGTHICGILFQLISGIDCQEI